MFDKIIQGLNAAFPYFGTFMNTVSQNSSVDKQIDFQREQNELAYQRALQMMNFQNVYNSPKEQVKRLREAGLNPNLAYGSLGNSSAALAPSYTPVDGSAYMSKKSVIGAMSSQVLNNQLLEAQIRNVNADTSVKEETANKTKEETNSLTTYNKFQESILSGQLNLTNSQINLNWSQEGLNDASRLFNMKNTQKLQADIDNLVKGLELIESQIRNIDEDTAIKQIQLHLQSDFMRAQMAQMYAAAKEMNANADLSMQQFEENTASWVYRLATHQNDATNSFLKGVQMKFENNILDVTLQEELYNYSNRHLHELERAIGSFFNGAGNIGVHLLRR